MVEIPKSQTRLCLVRHGETAWNSDRRIQGQTDIGLNNHGLAQADAAGRWLRRFPIRALYSSDLQRAFKTAALIGGHLGLTPQPMPDLRERRYGIFEGLTYAEAQARHPDLYAAMNARDPACDLVSGESLQTLFERVTSALGTLADRHPGESVVVVVHGGVLDIVNRFVRGNPLAMPRDFLIPNAGLNWIAHSEGQWVLEAWGETGHLQPGALDELPA